MRVKAKASKQVCVSEGGERVSIGSMDSPPPPLEGSRERPTQKSHYIPGCTWTVLCLSEAGRGEEG